MGAEAPRVWALRLIGVFTMFAIVGNSARSALESTYGVEVGAADLALHRHRGWMLVLLGLAVLLSAQYPSWRWPVGLFTAASKLGFVALIVATPELRVEIVPVIIVFDVVAALILVAIARSPTGDMSARSVASPSR